MIDSNTSTDDDLDDENGIGGTYKRDNFYFYLCDVHSVLEYAKQSNYLPQYVG